MTTFFLLRHAHSTANDQGVLAGRTPGISLSRIGSSQARGLSSAIKDLEIDRIISSPLGRCVDTITPLAKQKRKRVHLDKRFLEMDYGLWSGRKLKELSREQSWKTIQTKPTSFTFPDGESFRSAADRIENALNSLARKYPKEKILIVTHGDIIKIALQLANGGPIDNFQRFIVDTCSLSEVEWSSKVRTVVRANTRLIKRRALKVSKSKIGERRTLGGGSGV